MPFVLIVVVSFVASGLTLFSGFGLGTILMPAFALFFPIELAITLTAIVHLLNNIFKLFLVGRRADRRIVLLFGVPALLAALIGAKVLVWCDRFAPWLQYELGGREFAITPVKVLIAVLIIAFTALELSPRFARAAFDKKYLPLGGAVSGFFGGVSGHQGALRSAFLIKYDLPKEVYIATGVVIACLVDVSRISVYATHLSSQNLQAHIPLLSAAVVSAFAGAWLGNRLIKKITLPFVQWLVSGMLIVVALLLGLGLI
ncbi:MAG: sulfite exporter TauE/SafE family protein [Candidatus Omnitrophota bacterium]|nr:sulfite exporter TauE/SafE family protein [Candidatus Omnitrophota bacterium]